MKKYNIKYKKGFVSIEAILSTSVMIVVILVLIGFFTTLFPRIMLQIESRNLAQKAKIQGGLTDMTSMPIGSDIERFKDRLVQIGYDRDSIEIQGYTSPGNLDVIGVTPLDEDGDNYIKRGSNEIINIIVIVPANKSISAPLSFFGISDSTPKEYILFETVMSERW